MYLTGIYCSDGRGWDLLLGWFPESIWKRTNPFSKGNGCLRLDAFELWCWRRLLRVPWTARRPNQYILNETNPEYSLEGLMLKLKLQYFSHLMRTANSPEKTLSDAGKDWGQEKGATEDETVGWHHQLNGHEFEQASGDGDGQGSLVWCSPWVTKSQTKLKFCDFKTPLNTFPFCTFIFSTTSC